MEKLDNFLLISSIQDYIMMSVMIIQYRHFNLKMNEDVANKIINDAYTIYYLRLLIKYSL